MEMSAITTADTSSVWKFHRVEYFVSKDEKGHNKLYEWLNTKVNDLQVNAYDTNNHESIFKLWSESGEIYKEHEGAMKELVKLTMGREK